MLEASLRWYGVTLRWALRHRVLVMLFGVLILVGTAWEFWVIPKGFLPDEDLSRLPSRPRPARASRSTR